MINFKQIVPILCQTHNFSTIADLALRKAKYLLATSDHETEENDMKSIKECYEIVIDMFSSLD